MAKYDHGGGCPCGLYAKCSPDCEMYVGTESFETTKRRGSERSLWHTVLRNLGPFGSLVRIESPITKGIPDVVYKLRGIGGNVVTGWFELKELDEWPKLSTTMLSIPKLKKEQVIFLETWNKIGTQSQANVILQIGRDYLMVSSDVTRKIYNRTLTKGEVQAMALAKGQNKFPTREIMLALSKEKEN